MLEKPPRIQRRVWMCSRWHLLSLYEVNFDDKLEMVCIPGTHQALEDNCQDNQSCSDHHNSLVLPTLSVVHHITYIVAVIVVGPGALVCTALQRRNGTTVTQLFCGSNTFWHGFYVSVLERIFETHQHPRDAGQHVSELADHPTKWSRSAAARWYRPGSKLIHSDSDYSFHDMSNEST